MTLDQGLAFRLIAATTGMFLWGRFAYDLVAVVALLAGVLIGVVPADKAFEGFSDDIVVIVAAALVVSEAIARSGVVETAMRPLTPRLRTAVVQVPAMVGATLVLSMVTKNVGAPAILMPVALQPARRTGTPPSAPLMPTAFAWLIGGLVTLAGTSPNIIVARVRQELRPALRDVRRRAGRPGHRRDRLRVPVLRLAAAAAGAARRLHHGSRLQHRRLHR